MKSTDLMTCSYDAMILKIFAQAHEDQAAHERYTFPGPTPLVLLHNSLEKALENIKISLKHEHEFCKDGFCLQCGIRLAWLNQDKY